MTDLNPQLLISTFLLNSRLTCLSVQVSFRSCCSCFLCSQASLSLHTAISEVRWAVAWSHLWSKDSSTESHSLCVVGSQAMQLRAKRAASPKGCRCKLAWLCLPPPVPDLIQSITSLHPTFHTKYKWGVLSSSLQWHCVASWDGHKEHLFILSSSSLV